MSVDAIEMAEIIRRIPHRYPFLLVDRVKTVELGKRIVALKNVTINEPFFQGHFPGRPIMPGVLILEAMAQAAGIRVLSFSHEQNAGYAASIAGFLTKKPGICLTVSAPGFLNGLTALAHATTNATLAAFALALQNPAFFG